MNELFHYNTRRDRDHLAKNNYSLGQNLRQPQKKEPVKKAPIPRQKLVSSSSSSSVNSTSDDESGSDSSSSSFSSDEVERKKKPTEKTGSLPIKQGSAPAKQRQAPGKDKNKVDNDDVHVILPHQSPKGSMLSLLEEPDDSSSGSSSNSRSSLDDLEDANEIELEGPRKKLSDQSHSPRMGQVTSKGEGNIPHPLPRTKVGPSAKGRPAPKKTAAPYTRSAPELNKKNRTANNHMAVDDTKSEPNFPSRKKESVPSKPGKKPRSKSKKSTGGPPGNRSADRDVGPASGPMRKGPPSKSAKKEQSLPKSAKESLPPKPPKKIQPPEKSSKNDQTPTKPTNKVQPPTKPGKKGTSPKGQPSRKSAKSDKPPTKSGKKDTLPPKSKKKDKQPTKPTKSKPAKKPAKDAPPRPKIKNISYKSPEFSDDELNEVRSAYEPIEDNRPPISDAVVEDPNFWGFTSTRHIDQKPEIRVPRLFAADLQTNPQTKETIIQQNDDDAAIMVPESAHHSHNIPDPYNTIPLPDVEEDSGPSHPDGDKDMVKLAVKATSYTKEPPHGLRVTACLNYFLLTISIIYAKISLFFLLSPCIRPTWPKPWQRISLKFNKLRWTTLSIRQLEWSMKYIRMTIEIPSTASTKCTRRKLLLKISRKRRIGCLVQTASIIRRKKRNLTLIRNYKL